MPDHRLNFVDDEYRRVLAFGGLYSAEHDVLFKVNGAALNAPQLAGTQSTVKEYQQIPSELLACVPAVPQKLDLLLGEHGFLAGGFVLREDKVRDYVTFDLAVYVCVCEYFV